MTAVSVKSIRGFGVVKHPQLVRVSGLLTSCPNLKVRSYVLNYVAWYEPVVEP
jgi:hypothetical protein